MADKLGITVVQNLTKDVADFVDNFSGEVYTSIPIGRLANEDAVADALQYCEKKIRYGIGSGMLHGPTTSPFIPPAGKKTKTKSGMSYADVVSMHKVAFTGDDWALIVRNSSGRWEVKTSKGSHLFDNYFDAMLEVAAFYGVNVDESSDSKEQD